MVSDVFTLEWLARSAAGGFVILAAAAVAVRLCREPADRARVTALALVGALLVPPVALLPGLPRWSVEVLPPEPVATVATPTAQPATMPDGSPEFRPTPELTTPPIVEKKANEPATVVLPRVVGEVTPPVADAAVPAAVATAPAPVASEWTVACVVLVAYASLTAVLVLWACLGLWRLRALLRNARPAPAEAVALLREIAGPGADRVRLLVSDAVDAPVALAGWRPVIVLPAGAIADRDALAYGLAHEWSHVERGDVWRWYLVAFAQTILFYQPLFWWLRRQLRLAQDYLADARAAAQAEEPTDYAQYLVTLARRRLATPALALGITDRRSNLTRRVHMLL
ncbi:MAG TPA: M56 family metallopeptidase, partial [Gemmata sp.]|nr:M56 family metallopeptidase [Gemmata sp.]